LNTARTIALVVLTLLGACVGRNEVVIDSNISTKLDPVTSVTIAYSRTPFVFYRDDFGKAAFARNYVHLAPLEINRSGGFRYYIWLGIWNTMQDAKTRESRGGFESIVIFADAEPLSLEIAGWSAEAIGASEAVYLRPVASATDAYYEVTVDQLRVISQAKEIRIRTIESAQRSFELWDQQSAAKAGLREFLTQSVY
jgi:hypothetical protein